MSDLGAAPPILARRSTRRGRTAAFAAAAALLVLPACGGADDAASAGGAALVAPAGEASGGAAARPAFGLVDADQAALLAADAGVTVIDVRTPEEFAEGHIDGAVLMDFYSATFADAVAALDPAQPYLIYCRSGNRSGQTVAAMRSMGFEQVWDLDGGVIAAAGSGLSLGN